MRPTSLKPGGRVRIVDSLSPSTLTFVRRDRGRPNVCIFESAELGKVSATDVEVIRRFRPEPRPRG